MKCVCSCAWFYAISHLHQQTIIIKIKNCIKAALWRVSCGALSTTILHDFAQYYSSFIEVCQHEFCCVHLFLQHTSFCHNFVALLFGFSHIEVSSMSTWVLISNFQSFFQDDDEADTVGCCTLKIDNVTCLPPNKIQVVIFNIQHVYSIWLYDFLILMQSEYTILH